jgi:hypothetical protein
MTWQNVMKNCVIRLRLTILRKKVLALSRRYQKQGMMKTRDTREGFCTKKGTGNIRQNFEMENLNPGKIFAPEP